MKKANKTQDRSLSESKQDLLLTVRRAAAKKIRQEAEVMKRRNAPYIAMMKKIRDRSDDLLAITEVVDELNKSSLFDNWKEKFIADPELKNLGMSGNWFLCFGISNIGKVIVLDREDYSLFYRMDKKSFVLCRLGKERTACSCRDEWLLGQCRSNKNIADALKKISEGVDKYIKQVVRFVKGLKR